MCQVKAWLCTPTLQWNCLEPQVSLSSQWGGSPAEFCVGAPSPSGGGGQEGRRRARAGSHTGHT